MHQGHRRDAALGLAEMGPSVQGAERPRTSSLQASKEARGVSAPAGPGEAALCGLPAQFTTSIRSARNHIRIVGSSVDMVAARSPLAACP